MSGSDPSVIRGTGIGGGTDDCSIAFDTTLASPDPELVAELRVGEVLDIVSVDEPARGVIARVIGGPPVGAITRDILRLRDCIARGNSYEAEVVRVEGGSVTVAIRRQ